MRILSWNINGIRTLPQYHPWNTFKTFEDVLDHLGADIICFQEMKTSRSGLDRNVALPGRFHSFFSFPTNKGGYSGVAVYTDSRTAVPLRAEEGLSGHIQPKPPLTADERVSASYPSPSDGGIALVPDAQGLTPADLASLDAEGRALVLDMGLFVLVNLYCPNETSDERLPFKMNYHLMLQDRVRTLVEREGREVIVLGDMNVCAEPLDHGEGHLASRVNGFHDHPARAWFRKWREPEGPMVDVVRRFWPDRRGMYTCWNTKLQARETNYGARIDYILSTRGLLPWFKHGDIQASVKGSDHCPIYVDLHDEITLASGETLALRDAMHMRDDAHAPTRDPPRIAAKYWDEYSGKQTLLSAFFGKRGLTAHPTLPLDDPTIVKDGSSTTLVQDSQPQSQLVDSPSQTQTSSVDELPPPPPPPSSQGTRNSSPTTVTSLTKRKSDAPEPRGKPKKPKAGQTKLSAFFAKPTKSTTTSRTEEDPAADAAAAVENTDFSKQGDLLEEAASELSAPTSQEDEQMILRALQEDNCEPSWSQQSTSHSKDAWSQLMAPIKPPRCTVHGEPAKEYTVNKQGPNKGKKFFICSRPVGPGYDKGRSERLREEVDPRYRCNFFKWSSDVRRESVKKERPVR